MQLENLMSGARDALTVKRIYGDPYEKDGVIFIPAAAVRGVVGGGEGKDADGDSGGGGGFGVMARPVGAYRIRGDEIDWIPAVDVTRVIVFGQIVAMVALLVFKSVRKSRHSG